MELIQMRNLTLAQAHKSGRKYKRPSWTSFRRFGDVVSTSIEEVLATDYEIENWEKTFNRVDIALTILKKVDIHPMLLAQIIDVMFDNDNQAAE